MRIPGGPPTPNATTPPKEVRPYLGIMPLTGIGAWAPLDSHEHRWFWRPSQAFSQDQPSASWHHRTSPGVPRGCDEFFFFKNHVKGAKETPTLNQTLFLGAVCLISLISWVFCRLWLLFLSFFCWCVPFLGGEKGANILPLAKPILADEKVGCKPTSAFDKPTEMRGGWHYKVKHASAM